MNHNCSIYDIYLLNSNLIDWKFRKINILTYSSQFIYDIVQLIFCNKVGGIR